MKISQEDRDLMDGWNKMGFCNCPTCKNHVALSQISKMRDVMNRITAAYDELAERESGRVSICK